MRRGILAAVLVLAAIVPAGASGSFHLIKITEVGNGNPADFVELQMFAADENLVGGRYVRTYDGLGAVRTTFRFPADVLQDGDQRTILVGRAGPVEWPVEPDFTTAELEVGGAGAVCYLDTLILPPFDCVSFGEFPAPSPLPTGSPAPALPDGPGASTLQRTLARGCPTLLEDADDSDDSAADFHLAAPSPRNNATAPTERECDPYPPETVITKRPPERTSRRRPKIAFRATERGASFECKRDGRPFRPCTSPYRRGFPVGRHLFRVAAIDGAGNRDRSPAKVRFRRVRGRR
ncbi:MAG: hypothetical protein EDQ89_12135 [Acidobacteria bacterium]|nr:MAG: hypothetical protein EDQ89_12135 [Acidobacteriota bacterium]MCL4287875.1 hypothetical protein [Thermoleophilia bacterium]GIK76497.1 MAG: hypothetical protein BroJett022_01870 [Actinomycetes bacterium]